MNMQVGLVENGPEGIWSPDTRGINLEGFNVVEEARRWAEIRLREIAKWEDISGDWWASVRVDGEHIAEIEL